jgi:hypothetical protein
MDDKVFFANEKKTYLIEDITFDKWLDIFKENTQFSIKHNLVEINELASFHRKVTYKLFESFKSDVKLRLMLEYENKFGNILLTENFVLIEGWFSDAWDWTKNAASNVGGWIVDKVKNLGAGAIKLGKELVSCVSGGGCSPFFEDFREMLYSPVGIGVESFLAATGLGDIGVIAVWSIMLIFDGYLLMNNDPHFSWLNVFFDVLGIGAGIAAKTARSAIGGAEVVASTQGKSLESVIADGSKNPETASFFQKVGCVLSAGAGKILSPLNNVSEFLSNKLGLKWVGKVIDGIGNVLGKIANAFGIKGSAKKAAQLGITQKQVLQKGISKGLKSGLTASAFNYGGEKYAEWKTGFNPIQIKNIEKLNNIEKNYGGKDPFDM